MNSLTLRSLSTAALATSVLAALACAPANAGSTSASFQASLTIVGSCAIVSSAARPSVACNYDSAYRIELAPQQDVRGNVWTVTF